jgi:hypothetical protein
MLMVQYCAPVRGSHFDVVMQSALPSTPEAAHSLAPWALASSARDARAAEGVNENGTGERL